MVAIAVHNCAKQLQADFHHFEGMFGFNFWAVVLDLGWSLGLERALVFGFHFERVVTIGSDGKWCAAVAQRFARDWTCVWFVFEFGG